MNFDLYDDRSAYHGDIMSESANNQMEFVPDRFEDLSAEKQERLKIIIELRRRGVTNAAIAKLAGVGEATIYRDNQLLRKLASNRAASLDIKEEIGDALSFFDEIADKAMEGYRSAIEDSEQVVYEVTELGEKKPITKQIPDHSQASKYLVTAGHAKKQKIDTLMQVSTTHALNKLLLAKADEAKAVDIASLKTPEDFNQAEENLKNRHYEIERQMHIFRGPSPVDYAGDHRQYELDMAEHMNRFDEFMKVKEEFEKPWSYRKNRKNIDQSE